MLRKKKVLFKEAEVNALNLIVKSIKNDADVSKDLVAVSKVRNLAELLGKRLVPSRSYL